MKMPLKSQRPMRRVLVALLPSLAGSVYYFGWRCLAMVVVSCVAAFLTEYAFCRRRGEPVSEAVLVTGALYALILPPGAPWHVVVIGIVFAIIFAKEAFGGFGRNIFNPAMVGRCFVYLCFPVAMTSVWPAAAQGTWGALAQWGAADAITSATPMALMKAGAYTPDAQALVQGFLLGRMPGTMGATSALLALIGGAYLFATRTANRTVAVTLVAAYAALNAALHAAGVTPVPPVLPAVLGGGFLFGAFFMATDPVSSPSTQAGRVLYALLIAVATVVIRNFSIFNGGLMFALLLGNMFAPIIDYGVRAWSHRGRPAAEGASA